MSLQLQLRPSWGLTIERHVNRSLPLRSDELVAHCALGKNRTSIRHNAWSDTKFFDKRLFHTISGFYGFVHRGYEKNPSNPTGKEGYHGGPAKCEPKNWQLAIRLHGTKGNPLFRGGMWPAGQVAQGTLEQVWYISLLLYGLFPNRIQRQK